MGVKTLLPGNFNRIAETSSSFNRSLIVTAQSPPVRGTTALAVVTIASTRAVINNNSPRSLSGPGLLSPRTGLLTKTASTHTMRSSSTRTGLVATPSTNTMRSFLSRTTDSDEEEDEINSEEEEESQDSENSRRGNNNSEDSEIESEADSEEGGFNENNTRLRLQALEIDPIQNLVHVQQQHIVPGGPLLGPEFAGRLRFDRQGSADDSSADSELEDTTSFSLRVHALPILNRLVRPLMVLRIRLLATEYFTRQSPGVRALAESTSTSTKAESTENLYLLRQSLMRSIDTLQQRWELEPAEVL